MVKQLVAFEDWRAPWESDSAGIDPEKAKRFAYGLYKDSVINANKVETLNTEKGQLQTKLDEHESKDLSEVQRLQRENEKLKEKSPDVTALELEKARLELAIDNGLTVKQAKRLQGNTKEELEADVAELLADLGTKGKADDKGKEDEEQGSPFRRRRFRTGAEDGDKQIEDDDDPAKYVSKG